MIELNYGEVIQIKEQYKNATDSTVYSALQGYMGRAFASDNNEYALSMILQGDFVFPSNKEGYFDEKKAYTMLEELAKLHAKADTLIIPQSQEWRDFLKQHSEFRSISRYTLSKMNPSDFDVEKLKNYASQLPKEYRFVRMDETIATLALSQEWSKYFCYNFKDVNEYVNKGLGIAIMHKKDLICAASSYTIYNDGIEIEIATREDYRQKGLATMCGARLILECIKENKVPNWDAANLISVKIAEKLGYQFDSEYKTYLWRDIE